MSETSVLRVNKGNYFSAPIVVVGSMLIFAAVGVLLNSLYHSMIFEAPFRKVSDMVVDFFIYDFPLMVLLIIVGSFLIWTTRFFEFDSEQKRIREGGRFWKWERGEWTDFQPQCKYIAFQRYEQTNDYTYGGLYSKVVSEYVYDLRLIYADGHFESVVSASDFEAVSQIILLGKKMGEVYQLPFNDYVLQLLKKKTNI